MSKGSKASVSKIPLRQIFVLREVRIDAEKLRKGDVFRFAKSHAHDNLVDPNEFYVCQKRPEGKPNDPTFRINSKLLINPTTGKQLKFTWQKGMKNGR